MKRRWLILALLLAPLCHAQAPSGTIPSSYFGQQVLNPDTFPTVSVGAVGKESGATWSAVEPYAPNSTNANTCSGGGTKVTVSAVVHCYYWAGGGANGASSLDAYVSNANSHGALFEYMFEYAPKWATGGGTGSGCGGGGGSSFECTGAVTDLASMDTFANQLVTRYNGSNGHGTITYYEMANEPFFGEGSYSGGVSQFATEKNRLATDIRNASGAAKVGCCGDASADDSFIATQSKGTDAAWRAGLTSNLDFVSYHAYPHHLDLSPEYIIANPSCVADNGGSNEHGFMGTTLCARSSMTRHAVASTVPIWNTEGSYADNSYSNCVYNQGLWGGSSTTGCQAGTSALQIAFMTRYMLEGWSSGLQTMFWYAWGGGGFGNMSAATQTAWNQVYNWMVGGTLVTACAVESPPSGLVMSCGLVESNGKTAKAVWTLNQNTVSTYTISAGVWADYRDTAGGTTTISGVATSVPINLQPILLETGTTSLAPPTISPNGGSFTVGQTVILSGPSGAAICGTLDGSTPTANGAGTCTHGTPYASGNTIFVNTVLTVKAIATQSGHTDSSIASAAFTFSISGYGPPLYNDYSQSTATLTAPATPNVGGATGVNTKIYSYTNPGDPYYSLSGGGCITRATDVNSLGSGIEFQSASWGGGGDLTFSINRDLAYFFGSNGGVYIASISWDSNGCAVINNPVLSTHAAKIIGGAFGGGVRWSKVTDNVIYRVYNNGDGTPITLQKNVISGTTTTTAVTTTIATLSNCPGCPSAPGVNNGGNGNLSVDNADRYFETNLNFTANTGQGSSHWVVIWDSTLNQLASYYTGAVLSTENPQNFNIWGFCSGNCTQGGSNPTGAYLNTVCAPNSANGMHGSKMFANGLYAEATFPCNGNTGSLTYWQIGTNNIVTCNATNGCRAGGHGAYGYSVQYNNPFQFISAPVTSLTTISTLHAGFTGAALDEHGAEDWAGTGGDVNPWLMAVFPNTARPCDAVPYDCELIAMRHDGVISRFTPTYDIFTTNANDLAVVTGMSSDGDAQDWNSNWNGALGNDPTGTCVPATGVHCRSDLFIFGAEKFGGTATAPTFSPGTGPYTSPLTVTITNSDINSITCYNLTGSPATNGGTGCAAGSVLYTGIFSITSSATVYAVAGGTGYKDSAVGSISYTINQTAAAPTFAPPGGLYSSTQSVTLATTAGPVICFTINGTTPATNGTTGCTTGTHYTTAVSVSVSETVRAIAGGTGYVDSSVSSAVYTINLPAAVPVFAPPAGTYAGTQSVVISTTAGSVICFTIDGTTPATNGTTGCTTGTFYTGPVAVSASETMKAIAGGTGFSDSAVGSAAYTITTGAATPTFSPIAGTYASTQSVTIVTTSGGAVICYTTNGTSPATDGSTGCTTGTLYSTAVSVGVSETLKAVAGGTGFTDSSVGTAAYVIRTAAITPTFSPVAGTYTGTQTVTISTVTGTAICWNTTGAPSTNGGTGCLTGTLYTTPVTVSASETLYAVAGGSIYNDSAVGSANYIINNPAGIPSFNPVAGTYTGPQSVAISTVTPGATICYTLDGSTPTANGSGTCTHGTTYIGVVPLSTETMKALASAAGFSDSPVATAAYVINLPNPVFSPTPGTYGPPQTITLRDSVASTICYTTDGTMPTASAGACTHGTTYTIPFNLNVNTTVLAMASQSGYENSGVATGVYVITSGTVVVPTFSPVAGSYATGQTVIITSTTGGATICYTTDSSTPAAATAGTCSHGTTLANGGAINVPVSTMVNAIGTEASFLNSLVATATYVINGSVAVPTFSPVGGAYGPTQTVTIGTVTGGATICYTTDGSTPAATIAGTCSNGSTLANGDTISVSSSDTVKAIGTEVAFVNSSVGSATYVINGAVSTPTFSPVAGTYTSVQTVTISSVMAGATLCYTTDGTTPTGNGAGSCTHGTTYSSPIAVSSTETIKAIGTDTGFSDSSAGSALYTINLIAIAPTLTPPAGTYVGTTLVTIATTLGSVICYTTNGTIPATNGTTGCTTGTLYSTPVSVATSLTLKAIAGGTNFTDSSVTSGAYVINSLAAVPQFSPVAGTYAATQSVVITTSAGGVICYNTTGVPKTNGVAGCTTGTLYTGAISVSSTETLYAIAGGTGFADGPVASALYTIVSPGTFTMQITGAGRISGSGIILP